MRDELNLGVVGMVPPTGIKKWIEGTGTLPDDQYEKWLRYVGACCPNVVQLGARLEPLLAIATQGRRNVHPQTRLELCKDDVIELDQHGARWLESPAIDTSGESPTVNISGGSPAMETSEEEDGLDVVAPFTEADKEKATAPSIRVPSPGLINDLYQPGAFSSSPLIPSYEPDEWRTWSQSLSNCGAVDPWEGVDMEDGLDF